MSEAYERGSQGQEGEVDVGAPFVADGEATELSEPGEGALDDPSMPSETLRAFDAAPRNARDDAALSEVTPAPRVVVSLVGMQLVGPLARPSGALADGRDCVDQGRQQPAVVNIGSGQNDGEGNASGIDQDVAFAAGFAAIGGIGAGRIAPF